MTGTASGTLLAVAAATGERRPWRLELGAAVETLAVADVGGPRLLAGTATGEVHEVAF
ncbi:hypothetical protein [Dactylosporangium sp. CA-233914]|uniref:hypothetical protein n=1 Tax=Dactylosporangium sp. CA-233914 TaxID=3239934 RepID=UPI003D8E5142